MFLFSYHPPFKAVFIVGGRTKQVLHDCWSFDVDKRRWTRMKNNDGALGLSSHTLTQLGSALVVVGGKGKAKVSGDVWVSSTARLPLVSKSNAIDFEELTLGAEVGRGSFAKVLRASFSGLPCAVKKLRRRSERSDEEEKELIRFKQEVGLLQYVLPPLFSSRVGILLTRASDIGSSIIPM